MKVLIVTFIRAYNHGAVLQGYALEKTLKKMNIHAELLDYNPQGFRNSYCLPEYDDARYFPYRPLKNWKKYTPMIYVLKKRIKGFETFIDNNITLTKKQYKTKEEVLKEDFSHDILLVGSDQVWNDYLTGFDPVFFLDFHSAKAKKKMSYAASFGFEEIPSNRCQEYKRRLGDWEAYSVRENSGVRILNDLLGISPARVCDPTLLLTQEEWQALCGGTKKHGRYILVYYVGAPEETLKKAKNLAEKTKMKVVSFTSKVNYEQLLGKDAKKYGAKHKGYANPKDFLQLFLGAEYVLTDSFHGTIFSLIFHKKFLTLIEKPDGEKNIRVKELLEMLGLGKRVLENELSVIEEEIMWDNIDVKLQQYRMDSLEFLKNHVVIKSDTKG